MQWSKAFDIQALMADEEESVLPLLKPKVVSEEWQPAWLVVLTRGLGVWGQGNGTAVGGIGGGTGDQR